MNVGNRENPSYLPAEVCVVLPGQTIKRRLSPEQTQNMITFACRKPWENGDSIIKDGKQVLGLSPSQHSTLVCSSFFPNRHGHFIDTNYRQARFGVAIGSSLVTVAARQLQPPQIKYKNRASKDMVLTPKFGSWNMADIKFQTGSNIGAWTYIYFKSNRTHDRFSERDLTQTVMRFKDFLNNSGVNANGFIQTPPPPIINLQDGQEGFNHQTIDTIFSRMQNATTNKPRFVLCVIPFNDVAIYNSIKTVADTKTSIHTVCVVGQKFMKELRQEQYFGNISLKFNLKAGGTNQIIDPARLGVVGEGKTMVMGIDVTHPSPGSKDGAPSVAAVVASIAPNLGQWPGTFAVQASRQEMVSALEGMVISRLHLWQKHNKGFPENIIIYRDGVSEGQYQLLLDNELPQIRNACRQVYPPEATKQSYPKISIIVCGKRHHTRFYPAQEAEADRSSNCNPGTVVDRGVTEVRFWDFFIQPHACLQGTARPGHYYVILDEVFRGRKAKPPLQNAADALEELTHNMCHLFGRATKAVSLCPPAYYADLLCTRLRCYLSDQFDPNDSSASQSVASGVALSGIITPSTPQIADTLKNSMYYI